VGVVRPAGPRSRSPAGAGAGTKDGIALLPFQWRHLDASCVLPPLAHIRERMTGSPDPVDPGAFVASLEREVAQLEAGGYLAIVLHPFMLGWLGAQNLAALLDRIAAASAADELWVARCADVAAHVLADPERFQDGTTLDGSSWAG
jgi:hypothetical protein